MATKKRWLIGCGVGCLIFVALVIGTIVGFGVWVSGEGELLEPQKLLGSDTTGYLEWTLRIEDEGTAGFARELIEAVQGLPPEAAEGMPPWLFNWIDQRRNKETEKDIMEIFPMVAAWTLRPGEQPEDDLHLLSLSVKRFGNRLVFGDWIMGWILPRNDEIRIEKHRNEKIYVLRMNEDTSVTLFIRGGNVFFTSDEETARVAVDRLIAEAGPERETTELDRLFGETGGTLRGGIDNRRGELLRVWQTLSARSRAAADPELWNGFSGVSVSGGLEADGSLVATLRFHGDKAWIEQRALDLVMELYEGFKWNDLEPDVQARPFDEGLAVELTLPRLTDRIGGLIHHDRSIDTDAGKVKVDF